VIAITIPVGVVVIGLVAISCLLWWKKLSKSKQQTEEVLQALLSKSNFKYKVDSCELIIMMNIQLYMLYKLWDVSQR
jgi:Flp pilus assembly protein TadB